MALFREATPSVVFVTSLVRGTDPLTLDALELPQGSGSGFVWDDAGHVVTNLHGAFPAMDIYLGDLLFGSYARAIHSASRSGRRCGGRARDADGSVVVQGARHRL